MTKQPLFNIGTGKYLLHFVKCVPYDVFPLIVYSGACLPTQKDSFVKHVIF